jgi:hypothetical protein
MVSRDFGEAPVEGGGIEGCGFAPAAEVLCGGGV